MSQPHTEDHTWSDPPVPDPEEAELWSQKAVVRARGWDGWDSRFLLEATTCSEADLGDGCPDKSHRSTRSGMFWAHVVEVEGTSPSREQAGPATPGPGLENEL